MIPAYNSERTIADCIHSIRIQSQQPAFVMVVNDCSTDGTRRISESLGVFTWSNSARVGKAASINGALDFMHTDYLLILDSDTYLERGFIEEFSKIVDSHNYDGGSGKVKYIGRNKFAKGIAKRWHSRSWKYNGCCQFFKTDVIKKLKYDESTYVEDEEIYQRMKSMNTTMIDAWVYTEVTSSRRQYLNQSLRWERGNAQLLLKNRNYSGIIIWFIVSLFPIFLFSFIFYYIKSDIEESALAVVGLLLWGCIRSEWSLDIKEIVKGAFSSTLVFIEIFLLRHKFDLNNWERGESAPQ